LSSRDELLALHFAVGRDCGGDDDDEDDGEYDDEDVEEVEGAVESAGGVVGIRGAVGFLCEERGGGELEVEVQCVGLGRFDLRSWGFYDGGAADVAACFSAPLDAVSPPGGVAQMVRATDS
jgi:hypothetical protein